MGYDKENDCNYVYNPENGEIDCVKRDCEWSFYSNNCSWRCEKIVPPSNQTGVCDYKCEDIKLLFDTVAYLKSIVEGLSNQPSNSEL